MDRSRIVQEWLEASGQAFLDGLEDFAADNAIQDHAVRAELRYWLVGRLCESLTGRDDPGHEGLIALSQFADSLARRVGEIN